MQLQPVLRAVIAGVLCLAWSTRSDAVNGYVGERASICTTIQLNLDIPLNATVHPGNLLVINFGVENTSPTGLVISDQMNHVWQQSGLTIASSMVTGQYYTVVTKTIPVGGTVRMHWDQTSSTRQCINIHQFSGFHAMNAVSSGNTNSNMSTSQSVMNFISSPGNFATGIFGYQGNPGTTTVAMPNVALTRQCVTSPTVCWMPFYRLGTFTTGSTLTMSGTSSINVNWNAASAVLFDDDIYLGVFQ